MKTLYLHKNKTTYPVKFDFIKFSYNNTPSYLVTSLDITKEIQAQNKESNQEKFLKEIVNIMPGAIYCKDYQKEPGTYVLWNKKAQEMFGIDSKEALGKSDFDFFSKEQATFFQGKDVESIKTMKEVFVSEEKITSPNDKKYSLKTWKVPMVFDELKYLVGISLDITKEKELEKELEKEKMVSFHNSKLASLGEMASGVAHEINNPLALIQIYNLKIKKMYKKNDLTKLPELLERVEKEINRISKIVSSMSNISRDSSDDEHQEVSLNYIIGEVEQLSSYKLNELGIKLIVENELEADLSLWCRAYQIEQILINLLNNAVKIAKVHEEKWIKIKLRQNSEKVFVHVIDPGAGIPAGVEDKIFEPFYTTADIGNGTGLSVSRTIAKEHGAELDYFFDGANTNFILTLPKLKPMDESE